MTVHLCSSSPTVCVIVPVYNEEASLPMLRTRLQALEFSLSERFKTHYIFVDDGSTDDTSRLIAEVLPESISFEVRTHAANQGLGAAFRTGFHYASADVVCTIDADCSYSPEHLLQMIEEVESDRTDVIVASPYHPLGGVLGVQRWRLLLSQFCSRLYRIVSPLQLYTYTSIFRAYRGSFTKNAQFRSNNFVSAVELLLSASHLGYRISEMPLMLSRRSAGTSKMRIVGTIMGHLTLLTNCVFACNGGYPNFCRRHDSQMEEQQIRNRGSYRKPEVNLEQLANLSSLSAMKLDTHPERVIGQ